MNKVLFLFVLLFGTVIFAQDTIETKELYDHLSYLASDSLEGRKPGTKGGELAARYIAAQFKKIGLKPLADDYFQYFKVVSKVELAENNSLTVNNEDFKVKEDFIPLGFTDNKTLSANVVFAGYGC